METQAATKPGTRAKVASRSALPLDSGAGTEFNAERVTPMGGNGRAQRHNLLGKIFRIWLPSGENAK